jgi:AraC family transcriptional regulator
MLLADLLPTLQLDIVAIDSNWVGRWWNFKKINSPFSRLFLVRNGCATLKHHDTHYQLSPEKMHLIPCFSDCDYICEDAMELSYIHFTSRVMGGRDLFSLPGYQYDLVQDGHSIEHFEALKNYLPKRHLITSDPKSKHNMMIPSRSLSAHPEETPLGRMKADIALRQLLIPFIATLTEQQNASLHRLSSLKIVLDYIENNLPQQIKLEDLAAMCHQSPNYFSSQFFKIMGLRPIAYINRKRIEMSQSQLIISRKSIKQIAYESGFSCSAYFCRMFKNQIGVRPEEYRKNHIY